MGHVLQGSLPTLNDLRQFSLLNCIRNYLLRSVERGLRASAWLWAFEHTSCSLSNQGANGEVYTSTKSLEYLPTSIAQKDLSHQIQLPKSVPTMRFRDSHVDQEAGQKCRWVWLPDSGHTGSQHCFAGPELFTDNPDTSGTTKDLSQDKKEKRLLFLKVPEIMRNTLSSDPSLSAFHPVIRKRPSSYFQPRPVKATRSLDMSLLLEENVDCCPLCSGVAARSSGPGQRDDKAKVTENYEVTAGPSSSDQHELVNSPSNQKSMKTAPFTDQVLKCSKSVPGGRVTSTFVHGKQRSSKYLEDKHRCVPSTEQGLIPFSCSEGYHKHSISLGRKHRQSHTDQSCPKSTNLEQNDSKQLPSAISNIRNSKYIQNGLTSNFTSVQKLKSLAYDREDPTFCKNTQADTGADKWAQVPRLTLLNAQGLAHNTSDEWDIDITPGNNSFVDIKSFTEGTQDTSCYLVGAAAPPTCEG